MRVADLLLRGAGGEPVDFARTIVSHGVAELPPNRVDEWCGLRPEPGALSRASAPRQASSPSVLTTE
jgi:hypothetical protein